MTYTITWALYIIIYKTIKKLLTNFRFLKVWDLFSTLHKSNQIWSRKTILFIDKFPPIATWIKKESKVSLRPSRINLSRMMNVDSMQLLTSWNLDKTKVSCYVVRSFKFWIKMTMSLLCLFWWIKELILRSFPCTILVLIYIISLKRNLMSRSSVLSWKLLNLRKMKK